MSVEVFRLPVAGDAAPVTELRLDARGLEWTEANGHEKWMPFACIRLAAVGRYTDQKWRLRLSGPPGTLTISSGTDAASADVRTFANLAQRMIEGADAAGCGTQFRFKRDPIGPNWLWARTGQKRMNGVALIGDLPLRD